MGGKTDAIGPGDATWQTERMNIRVVKPADLTPQDLQLWKQYQQRDTFLANPFLCPEYIMAVSEIQEGVQVGIMECGSEIVGFFPFQKTTRNIGDPVGLRLCDISGPILKGGIAWDPKSVVRASGLSGWHFQNLIRSQTMQPFEWACSEAPYLDLRGGFDKYKQERKRNGSNLFDEVARKARKLERAIGPVRFQFHISDDRVFAQLLEWKGAQRDQTKTFNVLSMGWARALLKRIEAIQTEDFAGLLSVLWAGDQLAAIHLGLRSRSILHYWIPTYNPGLGRYSPGSILLLETARAASEMGITRLDLGAGNERYKHRFKSNSLMLGFGSVNCSLVSVVLSRIRCASHRCTVSSPLYAPIASVKGALQRAYYWTLFRSTGLKRSEV